MTMREIDPSVWNAQPIKELVKKEIRALIKSCDSIQIFIHPSYWTFDDNTVPRIEVSKVWATEFVRIVPIDSLPGVQVIEHDGETLMRWWPQGTYNQMKG